jgi:AraC-like DNA-binding protein
MDMPGSGANGVEADEPYFAERTRLDEAATLSARSLERAGLSMACYRRNAAGLGLTEANPVSNLFMAVVNLRSLPAHGGWREGRYQAVPEMRPGSLACLDFRESWVSDLPHPFHTFHLFVPQSSFDQLTEELHAPRIQGLDCSNADERYDGTMHHLALSLMPLFARPQEVSALFADHVSAAMRLHLAVTYGGLMVPPQRARSGLAPWQERRAKELMLDDMTADLGIAELAKECGLSARQFERAFRQSVGMPPHQWRMQQRIQRAKVLLEGGKVRLSEVALNCGFSDQSHFTKVFARLVGSTPAVYRRVRRR